MLAPATSPPACIGVSAPRPAGRSMLLGLYLNSFICVLKYLLRSWLLTVHSSPALSENVFRNFLTALSVIGKSQLCGVKSRWATRYSFKACIAIRPKNVSNWPICFSFPRSNLQAAKIRKYYLRNNTIDGELILNNRKFMV